jgi:hypothetical protein
MLALVIVAGVVLLFALLVVPLWWPYFQAWRRQRAMSKWMLWPLWWPYFDRLGGVSGR